MSKTDLLGLHRAGRGRVVKHEELVEVMGEPAPRLVKHLVKLWPSYCRGSWINTALQRLAEEYGETCYVLLPEDEYVSPYQPIDYDKLPAQLRADVLAVNCYRGVDFLLRNGHLQAQYVHSRDEVFAMVRSTEWAAAGFPQPVHIVNLAVRLACMRSSKDAGYTDKAVDLAFYPDDMKAEIKAMGRDT